MAKLYFIAFVNLKTSEAWLLWGDDIWQYDLDSSCPDFQRDDKAIFPTYDEAYKVAIRWSGGSVVGHVIEVNCASAETRWIEVM